MERRRCLPSTRACDRSGCPGRSPSPSTASPRPSSSCCAGPARPTASPRPRFRRSFSWPMRAPAACRAPLHRESAVRPHEPRAGPRTPQQRRRRHARFPTPPQPGTTPARTPYRPAFGRDGAGDPQRPRQPPERDLQASRSGRRRNDHSDDRRADRGRDETGDLGHCRSTVPSGVRTVFPQLRRERWTR